jgi:hypothetical protein
MKLNLQLSSLLIMILMISLIYFYEKNNNDNELYIKLSIISFFGGFFSILNHCVSGKYFKYLDRIYMLISFIFHLQILNTFLELLLLIIPVILYFLSKIYKKKYLHVTAHLIIILYHIILFQSLL